MNRPISTPLSPPIPRRLRSLALATAAVAVAAVAGLTACSGSSESQLLQAATAHLDRGDARAAFIELRNAVQQHPHSGPVRMAMGKALLESGDAAGAAVEFEKAVELQVAPESVVPMHARALLASGEGQKVLARYAQTRLADRSANADLQSTVATAHLQAGQHAAAQTALAAALADDPQSPWALLLQARQQAAEGRNDAALESVRRAQVTHPDKAQLLLLEGQLRLAAHQDAAGAERAFQAALLARPDFAPAHAALVGLALHKGDSAQARRQIETMAKVAPRHPQTLLLQGRLALTDGQVERAEELAQQLLRISADDPRTLLLAGEVALRRGAFAQAETHLSRVIARAPESTTARRLLAQAHLKSKRPDQALQVLQPALDRKTPDTRLLALAAQAHLMAGRSAKADALFRRAAEAHPEDTRIRTAAALSKAAQGHRRALEELESIAAQDKGHLADLALVGSRLQQQDHEGALRAVRAMERKQPDKPLAADLEARVLLASGRAQDARASLERAQRLDPDHMPSAVALAALDLGEGRLQEAHSRLEKMAEREGAHRPQALLALAEVKGRSGAPAAEIDAALARALKASPESPAAHLALIGHRLRQQDKPGALKAAQDAVAALPHRPEMLEALGRTQYAAGDQEQAVATVRKLAQQLPHDHQPLMLLAQIHAAQNDLTQLRQTLRRVVELKPDLAAPQQQLIALDLKENRRDDALAMARKLQRSSTSGAVGHLIEGDIHAMARQWDEAAKSYRSAQKAAPSAEAAIKLHSALLAADRKADASKMAAEWEKRHPEDVTFQVHLGNSAASQQNWAVAERHFARAEKLRPQDPLILNNMAYVLAQQSKPGAVERAQRVNELKPDHPPLMDTLALALASEKKLAQALEVQRRAVEKAGHGSPELRLTLARLYLKAGDRDNARQELRSLASMGPRFSGHGEVRELLKSI